MEFETKIKIDFPESEGKYYLIVEEPEHLTERKSRTIGLTKTKMNQFLKHNKCIALRGIYPVFESKIRKTEDIINEWIEKEKKTIDVLDILKNALLDFSYNKKNDDAIIMEIISHPDNKHIGKKYQVLKENFFDIN